MLYNGNGPLKNKCKLNTTKDGKQGIKFPGIVWAGTYSTDKRIVSFFCKVSQSCTRIYDGSSAAWCCKYGRVNGQSLPIYRNALQIHVVMWPENLDI